MNSFSFMNNSCSSTGAKATACSAAHFSGCTRNNCFFMSTAVVVLVFILRILRLRILKHIALKLPVLNIC